MSIVATLIAMIALAASPVTLPPAAGVVDYQLGGAYPPAPEVQIVIRDRGEQPVAGVYSICYVNSFQTQPGTLRWWREQHPTLLLRDAEGRLVRDPDWPDEVLLDIRTSTRRAAIGRLNRAWFARCARDGFRAVEPDNLDSWTRSRGLLKKSYAIRFAERLVREAHGTRIAIAQKNAPELSTRGIGFDFAVAEECQVHRECDDYVAAYGRGVIEIEYSDNGWRHFTAACAARSGRISILVRDREVVPRDHPTYLSRTC